MAQNWTAAMTLMVVLACGAEPVAVLVMDSTLPTLGPCLCMVAS